MSTPMIVRGDSAAMVDVSTIEHQPVHGGTLRVKPLLHGDEMMCFEVHYEAGVGAPMHVHDHESMIYVVSGRVRSRVGEDTFELGPGDACRHPGGVAHNVEAIEESVMLEFKSPAPAIAALFGG